MEYKLRGMRWSRLRDDDLRPNREQFQAALRSGFLWTWTKWQSYKVSDGLIVGSGMTHTYFPVPNAEIVNRLEVVRDEPTLREFVADFGLLGCGEHRDGEDKRPHWRGDDVQLCIIHARTIRLMRSLIACLHRAEYGGSADEKSRLAAEMLDVENTSISLGDGRTGLLAVGVRLPKIMAKIAGNPFWAARWMIQTAINANTEGIRPFVYFGSGLRTRTWLCFSGLYELAYWRLVEELSDDVLRKCRRKECGRIFEAKHRKQVYHNRRCLDIDKQARYSERKRKKGKKR